MQINIQYRYRLKSKIHEAGYRSVRQFCREKNINEALVSRLINGREIPDQRVINMLADGLGLDESGVLDMFV